MSTPSRSRIACLGLGAMGARIAVHFIRQGHDVYVWNRTPEKAAPLVALGAQSVSSLAGLRDFEPQFVFTNVSDSDALLAIVGGDAGLTTVLPPGATVVDNSSISPDAAREAATILSQRGITFLDAPVTGGTSGAEAGTLTTMVGGDAETFRRCEPLLRHFARAIYHVGPAGSGQACKLCNQVAAACAMLGLCEGLSLAAKAGLPVQTVLDVLATGSAGSPIVKSQGAKMLAADMAPGFRVDLMAKDLRTAHAFARNLGLSMEGSGIVASILVALSTAGHGDLGWQSLIQHFESRAGFSLRESSSH